MLFNSRNTIIYTSLIGQNEGLNIQPYINKSAFRHVCITDDNNLKSEEWEILYAKPLLPMDPQRSQRNFKIRPHLIFHDYKYSFYLDNTIVLKCKVEDFISYLSSIFKMDKGDPFFILPYHSYRENLISEFHECFKEKLDYDFKIYDQISDYIVLDSLALKSKPYWCGILLRNHMHENVINMSEIWFANVLRYTKRDQLSIIQAALQSALKIQGFDIDNFSSKFHQWPILKNERRFRKTKNNLLKLEPEFFEQIVNQFAFKNNVDKINFSKLYKLDYFKNSFHIFKKLEELNAELKEKNSELNSIKSSRTFRYLLIIKKLIDKFKFISKKIKNLLK